MVEIAVAHLLVHMLAGKPAAPQMVLAKTLDLVLAIRMVQEGMLAR
jgi:hypothetical protein